MPEFSSKKYWEKRYATGDNSGPGSYGRLSEFKADFLNAFVKKHRIKKVVEFGSGDGNQLKLTSYPAYLGLDVAETSIEQCQREFQDDVTKSFMYYSPAHFTDAARFITGDLVLSLDVIFHLVEQKVYEKYMHDLFRASNKYVIIYASNKTTKIDAKHVKHRRFTDYVELNFPDWKLIKHVKNPYPYDGKDPLNTSFSDFFVYKKKRSLR